MTFAGYNAGRGRVQEWVKAYGDPRDPKVDAVDWVERIPFAETRNYVQRVMESLQVYRVRLTSPRPQSPISICCGETRRRIRIGLARSRRRPCHRLDGRGATYLFARVRPCRSDLSASITR